MRAFQHLVCEIPAKVTLRLDEDGYMRIEIHSDGAPIDDTVIEVHHVTELELLE